MSSDPQDSLQEKISINIPTIEQPPRIVNQYFLKKKDEDSFELISSININNFNNTSLGSNGPFPNSISIGSNGPNPQIYSPSVGDIMNIALPNKNEGDKDKNSSLQCKYNSSISVLQNELRNIARKNQTSEPSNILNDLYTENQQENLFDFRMDAAFNFNIYFPKGNLASVVENLIQRSPSLLLKKKRGAQHK